MIRTQKRVVRTTSGREAIMDIGGEDEIGMCFQINFADGTSSIRAQKDLTEEGSIQNFETMESLERHEIKGAEDDNVWTSAFTVMIEENGFATDPIEDILDRLQEALESLKNAAPSKLETDEAVRSKFLQLGIADQVGGSSLNEIRQLIQTNTWSRDHCYVIPLLLAEIHGIEAWIHYKHLEVKKEPNVIRFTCSRMDPKMLCLLACKDDALHATRKIDEDKPCPGDIYRTLLGHFRLIRKIILGKHPRYVVETFEEGKQPQEFLMRLSTFEKMRQKHAYESKTPIRNEAESPIFGDFLPEVSNDPKLQDCSTEACGRRRSRGLSSLFFAQHPRISVISRATFDTMNEFDFDIEKVPIWDYISTVNITSIHAQIPESVNGSYVKCEEDFWVSSNNYMLYTHKTIDEYLVVGLKDEQPLIRIHKENLEIETHYRDRWNPIVNNFIKLDFEFLEDTPSHVGDAFKHLAAVEQERSGLRAGVVGLTPIYEEEPEQANVFVLPETIVLTRGVTETHSAHKFAFNKRTYLNQYCLGKELGRGSFGRVVFARDTVENRKVAIKIMERPKKPKPGKFRPGGKKGKFRPGGKPKKGRPGGRKQHLNMNNQQEDFEREIAVMKKIDHKNLVRLYELIDDDDRDEVFLILEYVDGGSLRQALKLSDLRTPIKKTEKLRKIFTDVLKGIEYLHNLRISHSDLKPANILMTRKGDAKLCDFGVSQNIGSQMTSFVEKNETTPSYKAPECIKFISEDLSVDGSVTKFKPWPVDIWACGVILLEMATGVNPFHVVDDILATQDTIRQYDPFKEPSCRCWLQRDMPREVDPSYMANRFNHAAPKDPLMDATYPELNLLIGKMLIKDPQKRIKLKTITLHAWVSNYHKVPWDNPLHSHDAVNVNPREAINIKAVIKLEDMDNAPPSELDLYLSPSISTLKLLKIQTNPDQKEEDEEEVETREGYILYDRNLSPTSTSDFDLTSFDDFDLKNLKSPKNLTSESTGAESAIIE